MKIISDYITSIIRNMNPKMCEIDDYDYFDKQGANPSNRFDIDFGDFQVVKSDLTFDVTFPFTLRVFYSYERKTKLLSFQVYDQAKKLVSTLINPVNTSNTDLVSMTVNNFSINKTDSNKKLLTLLIEGDAVTTEPLNL